jgi:hypothetical protein
MLWIKTDENDSSATLRLSGQLDLLKRMFSEGVEFVVGSSRIH